MVGEVEDEHTEFKEIVTKDMIKTVVAFSNSEGGHILVGVRDDGSVAGLDDLDGSGCQTVQLISDLVRPDVSGSVSVVPDKDRGILDVIVPEGSEKPYYLRDKGPREGGVYIRRGSSSIQAKEPFIRKLFRERLTLSFECMPSSRQDLTFERTSAVFSENGLEFGTARIRSLHMTDGETFNNLAYLLSDQCTIGIKLSVFSDEFKTEFVDRRELYGSVLGQVDDAMEFIQKHNSMRSRIAGVRREDSWKFPIAPVREILINAVVHRDYSINGDILVSIFGDRMTVVSLGGLPLDLGMDELRLGVSSPRNRNLADVFFRLRLIESYGTGIPRVFGEYRGNSRQPSFETASNAFKVTLPATDFGEHLSREDLDVLESVRRRGSVSRSEVEEDLGVSRTKAFECLSGLTEAGILVRCGSGRGTRYRMASEHDNYRSERKRTKKNDR